MSKQAPTLNVICAGCGYVNRIERDQEKQRAALQLHSHHTGFCPVSNTHIDGQLCGCGRAPISRGLDGFEDGKPLELKSCRICAVEALVDAARERPAEED